MTLVLRWLHLLSAIVWIGGTLFIALVLVPIARGLEDAGLGRRLLQEAGRRFRTVGWIALGVLIVTGLANLWLHPFLLRSPQFHGKLSLVVLALILSVIHDFVVGPRAGAPDADPAMRLRAAWVARVNTLVALAIVLLALSLRG